MRDYPLVTDRAALTEATDLMTHFGDHAQMEASMRADRSRSLGNVIHFCRWRMIERTIEMLNHTQPGGAIH